MPPAAQPRTREDVVVIDVRRCGALGLFEAYQDFAVQCANRSVRRALLKTGDHDANSHYTLVDVLRMVALIAAIPLGLKLAIVAGAEPVARVVEHMREELRGLGCDARVFRTEAEANLWLTSSRAAPEGPPADAGIACG